MINMSFKINQSINYRLKEHRLFDFLSLGFVDFIWFENYLYRYGCLISQNFMKKKKS